ncbi:hypothetical protein L7F22_017346 [Adiantum nelumboides]|nr:hypothetical protein [Adiantum nelumboides]
MSVFPKAGSPPPFFCQVACVYSAAVNEESLAMLGTNKLPLLDQRTTHRLQNTKQFSTYYVRAFSAVSLINNESHQEVVFPGVKRRGRPRKIVTDNGANSQDILQGTKQRGRPKKIVIGDIPREPKRRGRPRKTAVDNGPKKPGDSTNSYPFYVQENKQEHDPATVIRQGHLFRYTDIIPEVIFQQLDNECEVSQAVIQFIAEVSRGSIQSHGWFTIALPGGSLVKEAGEAHYPRTSSRCKALEGATSAEDTTQSPTDSRRPMGPLYSLDFHEDLQGGIERMLGGSLCSASLSGGHLPVHPTSNYVTSYPVAPLTDYRSPRLTVSILGREFKGVIVDGGSGINLMLEFTLEALGLQISRSAPFTVTLADQRTVLPLGIVEQVPLQVQEFVFKLDFVVVRLPQVLKALMDEPGIDWAKWHVFWVDERVVPLSDDHSNFKLAMETCLSKTRIPKDQIHPIDYEDNPNVVANKYGQLMRGLVKRKVLNLDSSGAFPQFDLILLGIGPDGHVASLFPNSLELAEEREWVVAVLHSPKLPPKRISMTLPCINAAAHVCFVVVGAGKAEVIQRILERPALPGALPAQMVRPSNGVLYWFVDKAAAQDLSVDMWNDPKRFPAVNYSGARKLQ